MEALARAIRELAQRSQAPGAKISLEGSNQNLAPTTSTLNAVMVPGHPAFTIQRSSHGIKYELLQYVSSFLDFLSGHLHALVYGLTILTTLRPT